MTAYALLTTNPQAIQWVAQAVPNPFLLPDGSQHYPTAFPWTSADGAYSLVAVPPFVPPTGYVSVGAPSYALVSGVVTETYQTQIIPVVTPAQTAAAKLAAVEAAGLKVTSTSTPAINGTYDVSPTATANFNAVETYVLANGTFPMGSTQTWFVIGAAPVTIPSVGVFKALSSAVAQYVAALQIAAYTQAAGGTATWPPSSVTIA